MRSILATRESTGLVIGPGDAGGVPWIASASRRHCEPNTASARAFAVVSTPSDSRGDPLLFAT
jgi:hypothetical protein